MFLIITSSCFFMSMAHAKDITTLEKKFSNLINHAAKRHSINPNLIKAVIWQESKFDKKAVGEAGEIGLMQIMPGVVSDWAKEYKVRTPTKRLLYDPSVNIEIGSWYLARALRQWHNYKFVEALALCEYNAGRRGMRNWVPDSLDGYLDIRSRLTRHYVSNILKQYVKYYSESAPQSRIAYTSSRRR